MRAPIVLSLLSLFPLVQPAHAGTPAEARRHFADGIALAQQHNFQAAIAELEISYRLNPLPEVLLDIALSQKALGQPVEAIENLRRYLADASARPQGLSVDKQAEASAILDELIAEIATLQISAPAGAELLVDGKLIGRAPIGPLKIDPGAHRIDARTSTATHDRIEVSIGAGRSDSVELVPKPVLLPPTPDAAPVVVDELPPPMPIVTAPLLQPLPLPLITDVAGDPPPFFHTTRGRIALGVGGIGVGLIFAGVVTGAVVLEDRSTYRASCAHTCDDGLYTRAHSLANTSDVLWSVGGAAAIVSAVLVLTRPQPHIVALPTIGAGAAGLILQGAF